MPAPATDPEVMAESGAADRGVETSRSYYQVAARWSGVQGDLRRINGELIPKPVQTGAV
jgi:hypothetical protein